VICWVYLHFRFRLLRLYRISLSLSFSLPLSTLLLRINSLSPGQDTSCLLYMSEISHSLPPSLSISGFWSTPRVKKNREEWKEGGKRWERGKGEFGRLRNDISHILSPWLLARRLVYARLKIRRRRRDGGRLAIPLPFSQFTVVSSSRFYSIILPFICPAASLRRWPKMTARFCLLNSVYVARTMGE